MTLPLDVSRCIGRTVNAGYELHPDCSECRRRTAPRADIQSFIAPSTQFPCEMRIEPITNATEERATR